MTIIEKENKKGTNVPSGYKLGPHRKGFKLVTNTNKKICMEFGEYPDLDMLIETILNLEDTEFDLLVGNNVEGDEFDSR